MLLSRVKISCFREDSSARILYNKYLFRWGKKLTLLYMHAILQPRHPGVHFIEWLLLNGR